MLKYREVNTARVIQLVDDGILETWILASWLWNWFCYLLFSLVPFFGVNRQFFFILFIYFETEIESGGGAGGEVRETESQAGSTLSVQSLMWGSHSWTARSWPEPKSRVGHLELTEPPGPPLIDTSPKSIIASFSSFLEYEHLLMYKKCILPAGTCVCASCLCTVGNNSVLRLSFSPCYWVTPTRSQCPENACFWR